MKKILKVLLYLVGSLIIVVLAAIIILWIKSPGRAEPLTGTDGNILPASISTIEKINLGGLDQYLIIRGADTTKPVMLFLHGGPGSPEMAPMKNMNPGLENDFLIVYWEQRGAGKSFSTDIPPESMNLEQMISDTRELTEILIKRFNREKIYLAGHSWGSFLGILTAHRYPELYHSYIGIGQVAHQYRGERVSFDWIREQAEQRNDEKALERISNMTFPDSLSADSKTWMNFLRYERKYVNKFGGGIARDITGMWPVIKMVLDAREYTFGDKINFLRGSMYSLTNLWSDVMHNNLFNDIDSIHLPVYIFQGLYDYQTPHIVAEEFFNRLKAPEKQFYTFSNSAHSPIYEEPDKFNKILREEVVRDEL
ncbi:MAG: alpha/beta hydrolase [Bacteroidales bacterium]|nr:alpha/beta hydrolase [Bacteroidales bacterium]